MQYKVWMECSKCKRPAFTKNEVCIRCDYPDDKVKAMLDLLSEYYQQPVMPLNDVCNAITRWTKAIIEANEEKAQVAITAGSVKKDNFGHIDKITWYHQGSAYYQHLTYILTDIRKSALLHRLIYAGERFRTKKCPVHNGQLNMQEWIGSPSEPQCEHKCHGSGWLPEPDDEAVKQYLTFCNKPYEIERTYGSTPRMVTEYCRKLPGHTKECSGWESD